MPNELDLASLHDLDLALRRVADELHAARRRRQLAADLARACWRGGERLVFDDACAALDGLASRTEAEVVALRRGIRALLEVPR